ncbi:hypothetical protein [Kocuria palustris]|uniref:hypothetical protein n=1 Tax=Kocuria palustris TaxID=71999 RepID=UPI0011A60716|nr:hypothetical protein [Kocuria palustris]
MARPPLSRLFAPRTLTFAAASGAAEMIPFHRARGWARAAIITAPGLAYAGTVAWVISDRGAEAIERFPTDMAVPGAPRSEQGRPRITRPLVGATAAISLLLSGSAAANLAISGAVERFLIRRGVRRPLLVMGAAGFLVGWITQYLDTGEDADRENTSPGGDHPADVEPRR